MKRPTEKTAPAKGGTLELPRCSGAFLYATINNVYDDRSFLLQAVTGLKYKIVISSML